MSDLSDIIEKEQAEQARKVALVYLASLKGGVSMDAVKVRVEHLSQGPTTQTCDSG